MNSRLRSCVMSLTVLSLFSLVISCGNSSAPEIPEKICGTPIDPDLVRPFLMSNDDLHEYDRVDRSEAITAPCVLLSGNEPVLDFGFSWDESAQDLMYLAKETGSVSRVAEPRSIDFTYKTVVGNDGAISTTSCKTSGGGHFTLTLQLPQINPTDQSHRKDIEKFIRGYFPATIKTLACA